MFASHYFLSTFADLFLPPKLVLFSLSLHFLVCMCNCVCGHTSGYKCSCAWNAHGGQMTVLSVGPQTLSTFDLGWGLSVVRNFTTWTRPADRRSWEFSSLQPHLTVLCLEACATICLLGGCWRSELGSSCLWGKSFIACSVSSLHTTLDKNLESSQERHCSMFVFLSNILPSAMVHAFSCKGCDFMLLNGWEKPS